MNLPTSLDFPADLWPKPLTLPTMFDLPSEDPEEPGLADTFHGLQPQLLDETLWLPQYPEDRAFRAFDLNLYYDPEHTGWHKRPDWFLAVGAPRLYKGLVTRSSYVMWEEKIAPTIVIEFLSLGTEAEDLGRFYEKPRSVKKRGKPPEKFVVYEEILKIPNYIVYDWRTTQLRFFRLVNDRYQEQEISPNNPQLWIPELNLGLGLRTEAFRGIIQPWLRWCDEAGNFFPTPTETANAETELALADTAAAQAQAAAAQAQAADAQAKLEALQQQQLQSVLKLLGLGLEAQQIGEIVGVTIAEVTAIQATL
jgi:Uma2 family endonuclease